MPDPTLEQMLERGAAEGTVPFAWFESLVEQYEDLREALTNERQTVYDYRSRERELQEQLEAYKRIRQVADDPELSDDFVGNVARRVLNPATELEGTDG